MKKIILVKMLALVTCMICSISAAAQEAYACSSEDNKTLTFYYDNQRTSRVGTTYDLNEGYNLPLWVWSFDISPFTQVEFDPSFANARPTSTGGWFMGMGNLETISGLNYLNTSEVTIMDSMFAYCSGLTSLNVSSFNTAKVTSMSSMFEDCYGLTSINLSGFNTAKVTNMLFMFSGCSGLTSLDLSGFNTAKVTTMEKMFYDCSNLNTIYVSDLWSTAAVTKSNLMFKNCPSLVGGMGTIYDSNHVDGAYAHIDGGPGNPGYFTEKPSFTRGDVNGDGKINITDVSALINYLLNQNPTGVNLQGADCTLNGIINITDVTFLINYLLSNEWP